MHICLLTPSFPPMVDGGVAIATGRLVQCLQQRGHRITVITTASPANGAGGVNTASAASQRAIVRYDHLVQDPWHDVAGVEALQTWAEGQHRTFPFDIILAYFLYPAGYLATVLGDHLGLPVVCSCRGNDISKEMFRTPEIIATVLERSTHLLCVSDSLLHMADTLVPCRAKATVVANAVDSTLFCPAPQPMSITPAPVVIGTSGLMRWKKGIDLFLPLVRTLCATQAVRVLIAGYGLDATIEQHISDFLRQANLSARVDMTGLLPHGQMVHALQRMDIYVSTSYQEGMPNGVLEAMACALPVVATDADGTPALVQDGVTGYLCPMGDLDALVERCCTLVAQPTLRQTMGQAGRRRVQQCFRPEQEATAVEAVLQRACTEQRTRIPHVQR